jgi:hypothetical protein
MQFGGQVLLLLPLLHPVLLLPGLLFILPPLLPAALTFANNAIGCAYAVWENGVTLLLPPHTALLLLPLHPLPVALTLTINAIDCAYVVWDD